MSSMSDPEEEVDDISCKISALESIGKDDFDFVNDKWEKIGRNSVGGKYCF